MSTNSRLYQRQYMQQYRRGHLQKGRISRQRGWKPSEALLAVERLRIAGLPLGRTKFSEDSWNMRHRLPPRRAVEITTLRLKRTDGAEVQFEAAVGFDSLGRPKEVFLSGAKAGSDMAVVLADTAVAISVALQHGVQARMMAQSISRIPAELDGPPEIPASVIGATLELLASYEREEGEEG